MATTHVKTQEAVADFRYDRAKRENCPPAGLAPQGRIEERPKERYAYNPHLPPVLRKTPHSVIQQTLGYRRRRDFVVAAD